MVCLARNAEVMGKYREKSNWDKILKEHSSPKLGTGRIRTGSAFACALVRVGPCSSGAALRAESRLAHKRVRIISASVIHREAAAEIAVTMMLSRELRLTRKTDFDNVIEAGRWWGSQLLNLRTVPNGSEFYRFGFSVSKAVGNAVVRNRVKRRLRAVVETTEVVPGFDVVVSARLGSAEVSFQGLKTDFLALLERAKLLSNSASK